MKKYLTLLFSIWTSTLTFAQTHIHSSSSEDSTLIQTFLHELADENRAVDIILSQHILVNEPSSEMYDYLEVSLEEVRLNIMNKRLEDLQIIPFHKMPAKNIRDIDPEGLDTQGIYFIYYKGKQVIALYLQENKIASFTLVSKGNNKAHFVFY